MSIDYGELALLEAKNAEAMVFEEASARMAQLAALEARVARLERLVIALAVKVRIDDAGSDGGIAVDAASAAMRVLD